MTAAIQSVEVEASVDQLMSVILDYERYPEFLPDMESVRVLERDGDEASVEFQLNLIQHVRYVLRLKQESPTVVRWSLEEGMLRQSDGSWDLHSLPDGRTHATYEVDVEVSALLPASIVNRLVGKTLPATLRAFKERAEGLARSH